MIISQKLKNIAAIGLCAGAVNFFQAVALGDETTDRSATEKRTTTKKSTKKKTKVTTTTPDPKEDSDYKVEAEKTKASAKVDAADAKVEAAETRAKAKIEATETKAKAQIDATETKAKAEKEATEQKAAAQKESTEIKAGAKSSENAGLFEHSGRMDHRFGAYASLWGDPFPAPIGLNIGYNLTDYLRTTIGAGSNDDRTFTLSTFGVGVKGMVPNWAITPVIGVNLSTTVGDTAKPGNIRGFNPSGTRLYATGGIEWQTGLGLNFGAGYAHSFKDGETDTAYFNVGLYL